MSNVKHTLHQLIIANFISVSNKPLPREAFLPFSNILYTYDIRSRLTYKPPVTAKLTEMKFIVPME